MKVKFLIERNGEDKDKVKIEFDRFVERTKGEIEVWSKKGSGWVIERIIDIVSECCKLSAITRRNLLGSFAKAEKQESDYYSGLFVRSTNHSATVSVAVRDTGCIFYTAKGKHLG